MRPTFRTTSRTLLVALLAGVLSALSALPAQAQVNVSVTGEVLYRERIALPPSARLIVQLQDVSFADAAATVIAEQTIDPAGKGPPYAFELTYDTSKIDSRFSYAVQAQIKDGDRLLFTNAQRYPVITQGNPASGLQIVVQSVGAPAPPAISLPRELIDRDWSLASLQRGTQDTQATLGAGITIRFSADGKVSGKGGCNGFGGSYTAGANRSLTIPQLISTLIACASPATNSLEQEYFRALQSVSSYVLDGSSRLQLIYNNGQGKLSFSAPTPLAQQCFGETGHCVSGRFLSFWRQNGGLAVFGLPLTDQLTENNLPVQWFERARFEWHPGNPAAYRLLLGRLGAEIQGAPVPEAVPPTPADVTLTNGDNGVAVGLKVGQTLAVRLDSNPTTGYSWQLGQVDGAVLKQQGEPQFIRPADAPPGAGGVQVFRFTATAGGSTALTLMYKRSFEPDVAPAQIFNVQVKVEAGAASAGATLG